MVAFVTITTLGAKTIRRGVLPGIRTVGRVRTLPLDHPGIADHRSPGRLLWWMARGQWRTLVMGMVFGIVWMSSQAVMPAVLGRAIDRGVAAEDPGQLVLWSSVMLVIGLVQAVSGIMRHRYAVTNWLTAAYRTVQLVGRHSRSTWAAPCRARSPPVRWSRSAPPTCPTSAR